MFFWLLFVVFLAFFLLRDCDVFTQISTFFLKSDSFRNKIVWIVGASSGIGEELAVELSKLGATLILSSRRENELHRVAERCKTANSLVKVSIIPFDILKFEDHARVVESALKLYPKLDYIVLNSGRTQRALALDTDIEVTREIFNLNTLAPIAFTKALLPHLFVNSTTDQNRPVLALTSSIAGRLAAPISSSYAMTKHALHGYFNSLQAELGKKIDILFFNPGPIDTPIVENAFVESVNSEHKQHEHEDRSKKMTVQRCAFLFACALNSRIRESWVAKQPFLLMFYLNQYAPVLADKALVTFGVRRVEAFKAGLDPSNVSDWLKRKKKEL